MYNSIYGQYIYIIYLIYTIHNIDRMVEWWCERGIEMAQYVSTGMTVMLSTAPIWISRPNAA